MTTVHAFTDFTIQTLGMVAHIVAVAPVVVLIAAAAYWIVGAQ